MHISVQVPSDLLISTFNEAKLRFHRKPSDFLEFALDSWEDNTKLSDFDGDMDTFGHRYSNGMYSGCIATCAFTKLFGYTVPDFYRNKDFYPPSDVSIKKTMLGPSKRRFLVLTKYDSLSEEEKQAVNVSWEFMNAIDEIRFGKLWKTYDWCSSLPDFSPSHVLPLDAPITAENYNKTSVRIRDYIQLLKKSNQLSVFA
jgi:hypothetical protein